MRVKSTDLIKGLAVELEISFRQDIQDSVVIAMIIRIMETSTILANLLYSIECKALLFNQFHSKGIFRSDDGQVDEY